MSVLKLSRRSANYTAPEIDCLLSYLEANPELALAKVGGVIQTADDYRTAWEVLAEMVTKAGPVGYFGTRRTGHEIKRKWHDMKSRVRAKAAALGKEMERCGHSSLKLSPTEQRVLALIAEGNEEQGDEISSSPAADDSVHALKVFSFQNESNSEERCRKDLDDDVAETEEDSAVNESDLLNELKSGGSAEKKRRLNEIFSAAVEEKRIQRRPKSEEQQITELVNSQQELNSELRTLNNTLRKCQLSIEKLALLKRAELRLKCAKYGVEFEDLFD